MWSRLASRMIPTIYSMDENKTDPSVQVQKLQAKLDRKTKDLEILSDIFSQIRISMKVEDILNTILERLNFYFGFEHSMILTADKGSFLRVASSYGYPEKGIGAKVEIGKGIIGTAAKRKATVRLTNIQHQLLYLSPGQNLHTVSNEIVIKLPGLQSPMTQIAIPLLLQDDLIGVISVESDKFLVLRDEDENIITLIANQAAIAIRHARMYEAEKQRFMEIEEANRRLSDLSNTQQQTLNLFMKYVPEPVVKRALRTATGGMFEGEQLEVTVLFCDIRDFTPISETLAPRQVVQLLNTYYAGMNEAIKTHGGVINQFVGDEIFVIFGAPVPIMTPEEKAVRCAIAMIHQLDAINADLEKSLGVSIKVGIGVHCGPVVTGNLGCEDRIAYSITGDTVNTAKRIETLTKEKHNSILASEAVFKKVQDLVEGAAWDPVEVKGKQDKLQVYEILRCIHENTA